jgi:hypothetical protein
MARAYATTPNPWGNENPDVLCLQLSDRSEDRCLPVYRDGHHGDGLETPGKVLAGQETQRSIPLCPLG